MVFFFLLTLPESFGGKKKRKCVSVFLKHGLQMSISICQQFHYQEKFPVHRPFTCESDTVVSQARPPQEAELLLAFETDLMCLCKVKSNSYKLVIEKSKFLWGCKGKVCAFREGTPCGKGRGQPVWEDQMLALCVWGARVEDCPAVRSHSSKCLPQCFVFLCYRQLISASCTSNILRNTGLESGRAVINLRSF